MNPATSQVVNQQAPGAAPGANAQAAQDAALRSASLYVGDLSPDTVEADLYNVFNPVAPVTSIRVCRHSRTRQSLGYAYVNFGSAEVADRVLNLMNYTRIKNRPCRIMWSQRDPSLRRSGKGNVFVKNLPPSLESPDLHDVFSQFGNILSAKVSVDPQSGASKGYGFVHFETEEAGTESITHLNGKEIEGHKVEVMRYIPRTERQKNQAWCNVFVKNLPTNVDKAGMEAMFAPFGKITSAFLGTNDDGTSRGFGFVNFEEHEEAAAAVEALNGKELEQEGQDDDSTGKRKLFVGRAQKKADRQRMLRKQYDQLRRERISRFQGLNLYVRNLDENMTDEDLSKVFEEFGSIQSARIMRDDTGRSRLFGFVCMSNQEEAARALSTVNGRQVNGKPLYVAMWQPSEMRRQMLQAQMQQQAMFGRMGPGGMESGFMPGPMGFPYGPQAYGFPMGAGMQGFGPRGGFVAAGGMHGARRGGRGGGRGGRGGARGGQRMPRQDAMVPPVNQMVPPVAPAPQQPLAEPAAAPALDAARLAGMSEDERRNVIGEALYTQIMRFEPEKAGKITGMLLEGMDQGELLHLTEATDALKERIAEALNVLREHEG